VSRDAVFKAIALALLTSLPFACLERGDRWLDTEPPPPSCLTGAQRCTTAVEECRGLGSQAAWVVVDDCASNDKICVPGIFECKECVPDGFFCDGLDVRKCGSDGESSTFVDTCDPSEGRACRNGACDNLCNTARVEKSNVGCEYWAVDLDNANIDTTSNAAAQQFAVVVSNAQPDVPVRITIEQDDSLPGDANAPFEIAAATIAPFNLEVFKLGPREIDGSPPGEFDTGTHTALTRHAYRIKTDFPVVAYQFNPLENVSVFSNDASLLYPRESFDYGTEAQLLNYVVLGWPQTIAATDDPATNFNPLDPTHLRATLTIVGTVEGTNLRVVPTTTVVGGGPIAETPPGGEIEMVLGPFDVLNLETGGFNADFSGTQILSNQPIAVFSGNEASDAPHFETLADRFCCADHLEDQLAPIRTAGKEFAIAHTPNRGDVARAAGADVVSIPEPEYVRFVATQEQGAVIATTLPAPDEYIALDGLGSMAEVQVYGHFMATSSDPVIVGQVMASQRATSVPKAGFPGGDPSLEMIPPLEQARTDYVFLTPDKYAFDFVTIVAPFGATVVLDNQTLSEEICLLEAADGLTEAQRGAPDPPYVVYTCQLSFPTIDGSVDPPIIGLGSQNDGVHRVSSNAPVFVSVVGWDAFVSYAYAAGSDLRVIAPPQ
jgi:hypothetical protein